MTSAKLYLFAFLLTGVSALIAGGVGTYVVVKRVQEEVPPGTIRSAVRTVAGFEESIENIRGEANSEFGKRAEALRLQHPFTPPADGRITDRQVEKFVEVKKRLAAVDEEMMREMPEGGEPGVGHLLKWNFFSRVNRLRTVQIEALEDLQMPVEEYRFVHLAVLKASMAAGITPEDRQRDWSAEMEQTLDQSASELDRRIAEASGEQRRLLEEARAEMEARRKLTAGATAVAEQELKSVPQENIEIVQRHSEDLAQYLFAAVDLDSIDFFIGLERTGLAP